MSQETAEWLNSNILVGFTDKRGNAWHYREDLQGTEPNHYPGAVPFADVQRRLFGWKAESRPVAVKVGRSWVEITDRQAIVRSDTDAVLGIFSDGYRAHQYAEWLLRNTTLLGDSTDIAGAGLLKGGAVAYLQIEQPENLEIGGFPYRPHLLAVTSFDGSIATTYKALITAVVCDNTLAAGLGEKTRRIYRVKHTRHSSFDLKNAQQALGAIQAAAEAFEAEVEGLLKIEVSHKQFVAFLDAYVPVERDGKRIEGKSLTLAENKREGLTKLYQYDTRVQPWAGTAFGVLQMVNTFRHHEGIIRGAARPERNMLAAIDGTGAAADTIVLDTLTKVLDLTAAA